MMWRIVAVLLFALESVTAHAAEVAGARLDDRVTLGGKELVLNGAGVRTRAIFKVYVAGLYLPERASDTAAALAAPVRRVQLDLLRTLSAEQLVDALNDGLKENNTEAELAAVRAQVDALAAVMKGFREVHEKDVVTLDFVDGVTRIGLNGAVKGTIAGEAFNRALLRVWLGERPVQADLKKAMLGGR
ncbi:MAG: chalcone isomerase family protein [Casimicrobiaceae bacterium]